MNDEMLPIQIAFVLSLLTLPLQAADLHVAVASNFSRPMKALAERFEQHSEHHLLLSFASTGKHYAQIRNGAGFDLLLAADVERPALLEQQGLIVPGSRFTYAIGRLVLWSPLADRVDADGRILDQGDFSHLAIANPRLAPYGRAAQQVLQGRSLWQGLQKKLVRGENIGQAYQFVKSGQVPMGFLALAQVQEPGEALAGSFWLVPAQLHAPIEQQAVLISDQAAARELHQFLQSAAAREIIRSYGYEIADAQ